MSAALQRRLHIEDPQPRSALVSIPTGKAGSIMSQRPADRLQPEPMTSAVHQVKVVEVGPHRVFNLPLFESYLVVDTRLPNEYQQEHIASAVLLPTLTVFPSPSRCQGAKSGADTPPSTVDSDRNSASAQQAPSSPSPSLAQAPSSLEVLSKLVAQIMDMGQPERWSPMVVYGGGHSDPASETRARWLAQQLVEWHGKLCGDASKRFSSSRDHKDMDIDDVDDDDDDRAASVVLAKPGQIVVESDQSSDSFDVILSHQSSQSNQQQQQSQHEPIQFASGTSDEKLEYNPLKAFIGRFRMTKEIWIIQGGFPAFKACYPINCSRGGLESMVPLPYHIAPWGIYLGSRAFSIEEKLLRKMNIKHMILDYRAGVELGDECPGVSRLFCDVQDRQEHDLPDFVQKRLFKSLNACWDASTMFINQALAEGSNVLVQLHGRSRSASVVMAWLIDVKNWSVQQALEHLQANCSVIDTSLVFFEQLQQRVLAKNERLIAPVQQ